MPKETFGCGRPECGASSHIGAEDDKPLSGLTFGTGTLSYDGFWEHGCELCARAFERLHPEAAPCWPFPKT